MAFPPANYVACFPLQAYFVDKDTGAPLSGGYIQFFSDNAFTIPKDVFVQPQQPNSVYTYTNIGSTVSLSSVGTTQYLGTDSIIFLYPFDADGNEQLYYIQVFSAVGVLQFTRMDWPPNTSANFTPAAGTFAGSQNVVSNPQFCEVVFPPAPASAYTYTVATASTINIAPDWDVICPSSGSLVVTQIAVTDANAPGLPAFALEISSSSFSGPIVLSQKITMSPRLLEDGFISGSFIAQTNAGSPATLTMQFVPSNPSLPPFEIRTGVATMGGFALLHNTIASPTGGEINTDDGITGYVQVQIVIPSGADVTISCVQLVSVEGLTDVPNYIQESTPRQIDHLYHDAYPIVPVGTVIDFAGYTSPLHYLLCDGTNTYDRVVYQQLFRTITLTDTVTFTMGMATYTDANAPMLYAGMAVESSNVNTGTTILSISGTTITLSNNAIATGSFAITYLPYGVGDTAAHFAVPDLLGDVIAAVGGSLLGAASSGLDGLGYSGGVGSANLNANQIAPHTHGASYGGNNSAGSGDGSYIYCTNAAGSTHTGVTIANNVPSPSLQPVSRIQPTTLLYKYIRYE